MSILHKPYEAEGTKNVREGRPRKGKGLGPFDDFLCDPGNVKTHGRGTISKVSI